MLVTFAVVLATWRGRLEQVDPRVRHPQIEVPAIDRSGLAKALIATAALLVLFATPLPRTEGVLLVAGALLISRRLATKRILGLVDWSLLVQFVSCRPSSSDSRSSARLTWSAGRWRE